MARKGLQSGTPENITVGNTTTEVLSATETANLEEIVLVNDSDEVIYVTYGASAEMNKGIRLNANGGAKEWAGNSVPSNVAINAICSSGSKTLCVQTGA